MQEQTKTQLSNFVKNYVESASEPQETADRMEKLFETALSSEDMNNWTPAMRSNIHATKNSLVRLHQQLYALINTPE